MRKNKGAQKSMRLTVLPVFSLKYCNPFFLLSKTEFWFHGVLRLFQTSVLGHWVRLPSAGTENQISSFYLAWQRLFHIYLNFFDFMSLEGLYCATDQLDPTSSQNRLNLCNFNFCSSGKSYDFALLVFYWKVIILFQFNSCINAIPSIFTVYIILR